MKNTGVMRESVCEVHHYLVSQGYIWDKKYTRRERKDMNYIEGKKE